MFPFDTDFYAKKASNHLKEKEKKGGSLPLEEMLRSSSTPFPISTLSPLFSPTAEKKTEEVKEQQQKSMDEAQDHYQSLMEISDELRAAYKDVRLKLQDLN